MLVSIYSNPQRDTKHSTACAIAHRLLALGAQVISCAPATAALSKSVVEVAEEDICKNADVLVVVGGDGTILRAGNYAIRAGVPMLCVNRGRVGFLCEAEAEDIDAAMARLVEGEYALENRMVLRAQVFERSGKDMLFDGIALNEFCVRSNTSGRMINIQASIRESAVGRYDADGLIIASPTGSTGYSLSAGGPVVTPELQCMLITPICAHNLQAKPIIVSHDEFITIAMNRPTRAMTLFGDGQAAASMAEGQSVRVSRYARDASFIRFSRKDFFVLLKQKLSEW